MLSVHDTIVGFVCTSTLELEFAQFNRNSTLSLKPNRNKVVLTVIFLCTSEVPQKICLSFSKIKPVSICKAPLGTTFGLSVKSGRSVSICATSDVLIKSNPMTRTFFMVQSYAFMPSSMNKNAKSFAVSFNASKRPLAPP